VTAAAQIHICVTHLAAHPWPLPGDQLSLPGRIGEEYRWLRSHPIGRWALLSVWLGLVLSGFILRLPQPPAGHWRRMLATLIQTPAATSLAAGRVPALLQGTGAGTLTDSRPGDGLAHASQRPAGHTTTPTTKETP